MLTSKQIICLWGAQWLHSKKSRDGFLGKAVQGFLCGTCMLSHYQCGFLWVL